MKPFRYERIGTMRHKPIEGQWDLLVHEYRMYHPQTDPLDQGSRLTKRIYAVFDHNRYTSDADIAGRWALIVYEWRGEPYDLYAGTPTLVPRSRLGKRGLNFCSRLSDKPMTLDTPETVDRNPRPSWDPMTVTLDPLFPRRLISIIGPRDTDTHTF